MQIFCYLHGLGGAFDPVTSYFIVHVPCKKARTFLLLWEFASTMPLWMRYLLLFLYIHSCKATVETETKYFEGIKIPLLFINLMHFPVFSTWAMFWPTLSAAMTGSSCFNQRLARMISIAAPIVTPSFCMYQSSLHLNQTSVTAKSTNRFKVLLNNLGCPQPLRVVRSIASCTGTLVYRLLIAFV